MKLTTFCLLCAVASQLGRAQDGAYTYVRMPGGGREIAVGANGTTWVIGGTGAEIYRWAGTAWQKIPGGGTKIAVDPSGSAWVVNSAGEIYRYPFEGAIQWERKPGTASDIGIGADGSVWIIGPRQSGQADYRISRWANGTWEAVSGAAVKVAVDPGGAPWVINSSFEVYRRDLTARTWSVQDKRLRGIAVSKTGAVFGVGTEPQAGGNYPILQRNGDVWIPLSQTGVTVAAGPAGEPWILTAAGEIFRGQPVPVPVISIISGPIGTPDIGLTQPAMNPAIVNWGRNKVPFNGGKLACSGDTCGATKADWTGAYQLDTTCDVGTYSTLYGGTCWTCPKDDGLGNSWQINLLELEAEEGCWRVPYERYSPANWMKFGWAWDCDASQGEYWDTHDRNGNFVWGGSCWKCANSEFPRRTQYWIAGPQACATPVRQTQRPALAAFNGCPAPDATAMGLKGKRQPGKPFLDIAGGWSAGVPSGGCFACPAVDEDGNFVITHRNTSSLINGKDNNSGCTIDLKWTPPVFPEPGLSGLSGVKEILFENKLFLRPDDVTKYLLFMAAARNLPQADLAAFVSSEWKKLMDGPYRSETLRAIVYGYIRAVAEKAPADRTAAETQLMSSFAEYIRIRRTFLATQGLAMYDAWKAWDEATLASRQKSPIEGLFYYGTVPLDFSGTLSTIARMGSIGGGPVAAVAAAQIFIRGGAWEAVTSSAGVSTLVRTRETTLYSITRGLNIFKSVSVSGLSALAGATAIQAAFAVITSVAIDQFMAIKTARPKLESALAAADQPVDLAAFLAQTNGEDIALNYWGTAMDAATEVEDSQIIELARKAYQVAAAKNFQP